jgi:hypothetical protein
MAAKRDDDNRPLVWIITDDGELGSELLKLLRDPQQRYNLVTMAPTTERIEQDLADQVWGKPSAVIFENVASQPVVVALLVERGIKVIGLGNTSCEGLFAMVINPHSSELRQQLKRSLGLP